MSEEKEYAIPSGDTDKSINSEKIKGLYASIRDHLSPEYRKLYNVRRFCCCVILFYVISGMEIAGIISFIWSVLAFVFWHYAYWSYQGGFIDRFVRGFARFGTFWDLLWKTILQNFFVIMWITLIAPVSGIVTWRKAVKYNKVLDSFNIRDSRWTK